AAPQAWRRRPIVEVGVVQRFVIGLVVYRGRVLDTSSPSGTPAHLHIPHSGLRWLESHLNTLFAWGISSAGQDSKRTTRAQSRAVKQRCTAWRSTVGFICRNMCKAHH